MKKKSGFNLVETLVASAILSGAVIALGAMSTDSLLQTRLNQEYETAAYLINRQLKIIDYMGIEEFIIEDKMNGEFNEYNPVYFWDITPEPLTTDSLYLITANIQWVEHGKVYRFSLQTILDGVSIIGQEMATAGQEETTTQE